jgi:hypothetical protein
MKTPCRRSPGRESHRVSDSRISIPKTGHRCSERPHTAYNLARNRRCAARAKSSSSTLKVSVVQRIGDDAPTSQCLRELDLTGDLTGDGDVAGTSSKRGRGTGRGSSTSPARSGARRAITSKQATAVAASTDQINERRAGDRARTDVIGGPRWPRADASHAAVMRDSARHRLEASMCPHLGRES